MTEGIIKEELPQSIETPQYFDETNPLFARVMGMTNLAVAIFDQNLNLKFYNEMALQYFEVEDADFDKNQSFTDIAKTFSSIQTTDILGPLQVQGFIENSSDDTDNTTNEVKLTTRKGLRLHIKRKTLDGLNIITAQDITENYIRNQTLSIALETGQAGYFNYNIKTKKYKIHSDYLRKQLTEKQMKKADAYVLASPEYNYSFTPALKNALDWGSRIPGNEGFKGKAAAIMSAGGGLRGGRSQYHLRQVAVFLDLFVLNKPEVMLSAFDGTFDKETGELVSERSQQKVVEQLEALKELAIKLKPATSLVEEDL